MKKYLCLLALVLGMSGTAWGYCYVDVEVGPAVCGEPVLAQTRICCTGECTLDRTTQCRWGNVIVWDVYLDCTCIGGCSKITAPPKPQPLPGDFSCGLYVMVVRVWCNYECWPYCMFGRPVFCGMGSTAFTVCCDDGCACCPCDDGVVLR